MEYVVKPEAEILYLLKYIFSIYYLGLSLFQVNGLIIMKMGCFCILFFSLFCSGFTFSQNTYHTYTLSHEKGELTRRAIEAEFFNDHMEIHHHWIDSLLVYKLDSVAFVEEMPELYEIYGTRVELNFRLKEDTILLKQNSPEYFAVFAAYHTIKALAYYKDKFGEMLDFESQRRNKVLKVYLGNFINCNPEEYVFNPKEQISPTTVYHEVGHRAFCQLDDVLSIGNHSTLVHNGLLEYFTVSMADYPVVGEGFLPAKLTRDVSRPVQYPKDLYYYQDFMRDFYDSYKDTLRIGKATRKLLELNQRRINNCTDTILMTHQSGLLITHPLWMARQMIGAGKMDSLVVTAMKKLEMVVEKRAYFLPDEIQGQDDKARWYDLLYALYLADESLFNGKHKTIIRETFQNTGYNTDCVRFH